MKKGIFAIVVILIIIGLGVGEQIYLRHLFDDLYEKTLAISQSLEEKDMQAASEQTLELKDWWNARKHLLESIVSHNETKEVTLRIAELEGYIEADDDKSAYATARIIVEMSTNLPHLLGFSWDTVA